jgi:hypothetical protein
LLIIRDGGFDYFVVAVSFVKVAFCTDPQLTTSIKYMALELTLSGLLLVGCLFIGSYRRRVLLGKAAAKMMISEMGSGSTGSTNVLRTRKGPNLVVLLIDFEGL